MLSVSRNIANTGYMSRALGVAGHWSYFSVPSDLAFWGILVVGPRGSGSACLGLWIKSMVEGQQQLEGMVHCILECSKNLASLLYF